MSSTHKWLQITSALSVKWNPDYIVRKSLEKKLSQAYSGESSNFLNRWLKIMYVVGVALVSVVQDCIMYN